MCSDTSHIPRGGTTSTRHLLRESYRANGKVLHRTMAHLSQCSAAESEAMRLALRHKAKLENLGTVTDALTLKHGVAFGAVWTVSPVARRLGIAHALGTTREGTLALGQVMARGIDHGARLSAVRLALSHAACDVLGVGPVDEAALSEHLDGLAHRQAAVEDTLFAQRHRTKPVRLFLSAVTRSYVDGTPNALAAFGYNRDGKNGKRQVVIGFLCDADGHPVSMAVLPGNPQDPQPCAAQVEKGKTRFGGQAMTCVGARGRIKSHQVADLTKHGFHSIPAMTTPQIAQLVSQGTVPMALCDQELAAVLADEGLRDVLKRHPGRAQAVQANRASTLATLQALVATQHQYLHEHPGAHTQRAVQQRVASAANLRIADGVELPVEERTITLTVHARAPHEAATRDGCSVLKTALTPAHATKELVHARSKDRAAVAQAFRSCHTVHVEVRPIFLRLAERTRAPAFVVMLAYQISQYLASCWSPFDGTVAEGLHALTTRCLIAVAPQNAPS